MQGVWRNAKNYTKYIATRETVEKHEQNQYDPNAATTEKQSEFDSVHIISYSLQNSKWFKRMSTAKYNADTYQPLIICSYQRLRLHNNIISHFDKIVNAFAVFLCKSFLLLILVV